MLSEALDAAFGGKEWQYRISVATLDIGRDPATELMAGDIGWHLPDITANQAHGIAPVAHQGANAMTGLGGAAVDDCDKITCDDEAVLVFPVWALGYAALFDDLHV